MKRRFFSAFSFILAASALAAAGQDTQDVASILRRVKEHDFHPTRGGTTSDRALKKAGVADMADTDWKVRTLAVRDMVRAGKSGEGEVIKALADENPNVRHLAAVALGAQRTVAAVPELEKRLREDAEVTVRSQAAAALGQIGEKSSLPALRAALRQEKSGDVLHQATMAIHGIETNQPATPELAKAFAGLDKKSFGIAKVGEKAPDFTLPDTAGKLWKLSDFHGKQSVLLVWIFADW